MEGSKLNYLNVGCGKRYHEDWVNIDILPADPGIIHIDGTKGLPFTDASMAVVYHSHVLEHIPRVHVHAFIQECFRVLEPGGVIRVVVPDLEQIAKNYLLQLDTNLVNPTQENRANYEWAVLELLDQLVRESPGGEMLKYITGEVTNKDYILSRNGEEVRPYLDGTKERPRLADKIKKFGAMTFSAKVFFIKAVVSTLITKFLPWRKLYQIGAFRTGGEVHKWMYDRYSLGRLLELCGFEQVKVQDAFSSSIENWKYFELDGKDGEVFKPDSLFVEARKPC